MNHRTQLHSYDQVRVLKLLVPFLLITAALLVPGWLFSQDLETEGSIKVGVMNKDNDADSVLVRLSDGTLGVRDASTLEQIQVLSISTDTIYLSGGGFIKLPADMVDDADADPANEIQILSISNDTIYLSDGGFVKLPADMVDDADADPANEIQTLSISGSAISLSNSGDTVNVTELSDADGDSKIQVEESSDEDIIRFDLKGEERMRLVENANGAARLEINSGTGNLFVGSIAGASNTNGVSNSFFGFMAGFGNTTGYENSFFGLNAGASNTIGNGNAFFGHDAGLGNVSGNNNTIIGYRANVDSVSLSNSMALGYDAHVNASNKIVLGNSAIAMIGGHENWSNYSDAKFKRNIKKDIPGIEFISLLRPVSYNIDVHGLAKHLGEDDYPEGASDGTDASLLKARDQKSQIRYSGFIAQEVEAAAEELGYDFSAVKIPQSESGLYALSYAEFVVPMVKAMQEQQIEIKFLRTENEELRSRLEKLEEAILGER